VKIRIRGFLTFKESIKDQFLELERATISLKDLLEKLCREQGDELRRTIFDVETGQVHRHISVLVNGRHYTHLPDRLQTVLKDGDEVDIFPPIAGGGY
jgi:molybdopterin synthase sulfur carrier subunit